MDYRIGLIGCGGIAGTWINAVSLTDGCRIDLVFDLDASAAAARAEDSGGRAVAELTELTTSPEINLVIIGTPTPSHSDLVVEAARNGKHVMCEKPMALDLASCQRMIDACAEAGVKLAIGHTLRFKNAFFRSRQLIDQGAIGTPVSASIDRMGATQLRTAAAASAPDGDHWRADLRQSGGGVLEGFIHEIDFTRSVFGDVKSVMCELGGDTEHEGLMSPQLAQALVRFESGALATMRHGATVALPTMSYWMAGTEGALRFTNWGGPVERFRHDRDDVELITSEEPDAYHLELCDLVNAIEGNGDPENSGMNGKRNVALALAMYRSHESGRRIEFEGGMPVDVADDYRNTTW